MSGEDRHRRIADAVEARLVALRAEGLPAGDILAVALASVLGIIVDLHGGDAAADAVEIAALRVRACRGAARSAWPRCSRPAGLRPAGP